MRPGGGMIEAMPTAGQALSSVIRGVQWGLDRMVSVGYGVVYDYIVERFRPYQELHDDVLRLVESGVPAGTSRREIRVLDVACGPGNFTLHVAGAGFETVGVDAYAGLVELAREKRRARHLGNLAFRHADLARGGVFPESTFDQVVNIHSLYVQPDPQRFLREVHKVRQINVDPREPAMSSEILNEDFYGFWGYVHEHDWRLLGRATLLAPVGVKAEKPTYSAGRGYPADPWEPRQMFVVEATPRVPNHPYGKRVLYIDEQMGVPLYVLAYDPHARHYKTLFTLYGNPAFSPGNEQVRAPLWLGTAAVNHASHEASVTAINRVVVENRVQEDRFTIGQLAQLAR